MAATPGPVPALPPLPALARSRPSGISRPNTFSLTRAPTVIDPTLDSRLALARFPLMVTNISAMLNRNLRPQSC